MTYECGRKRQDVWSKKTWEADPKDVEARIAASEAAKRRVEGFTDPENKAMAQAQLKAKQKDLREFIDKTNADEGATILKRDTDREISSAAELTDKGKDDIIKAEEARKLLRSKIESGELPLTINQDKQKRHILPDGATEMPYGRSHLNISLQEAQEEINKRHLTGDIHVSISPSGIQFKETIESDRDIAFDARSKTISNRATIHYSNTGTHLVPAKRRDNN